MESIMHKLRFLQQEMGPAERRIATYILNHTGEMVALSISELAAKCECGDATVVRLSRRLGLEGYQALKIKLAGELGASSTLGEEVQKGDSCYEIFRKRNVSVVESLMNTESVLDAAQLDRVAELIMQSPRVVIFGLGNSAAIAQDAAHKLLRLGLSAQACCDNHMQAIIASHLKRGCVAIGISHSGASRDIVEALQLCKVCGATTVCVTNYGDSPIVAASDIALFTKSEETKYSILGMSSRFAQLAIFDSIYTYIVLNSDKAAKQAIYNTETALQNKKY